MTTIDFLKSAQSANENYSKALALYNAALMKGDFTRADSIRFEALCHVEAYLDALAAIYRSTNGT
jgi:hypothetical protein